MADYVPLKKYEQDGNVFIKDGENYIPESEAKGRGYVEQKGIYFKEIPSEVEVARKNVTSGSQRAISSLAGLPVDIINSTLEGFGVDTAESPVGGSAYFKNMMEKAGLDPSFRDVSTPARRASALAGEEVVGGLAGLGLLTKFNRGAQASLEAAPARFVAGEAGAVAGGTGALVGSQEIFGENTWTDLASNMIGSLGLQTVVDSGIKAASRKKQDLTKDEVFAAGYFQSAVSDRIRAIDNLVSGDPDAVAGQYSSAALSKDSGLLSTEKAFSATSKQMKQWYEDIETPYIQEIKHSISNITGAISDVAVRDKLFESLNRKAIAQSNRMIAGVDKAIQDLNNLVATGKITPEKASEKARQIISKQKDRWKWEEDSLYNKVKDFEVGTGKLKEAWTKISADVTDATRSNKDIDYMAAQIKNTFGKGTIDIKTLRTFEKEINSAINKNINENKDVARKLQIMKRSIKETYGAYPDSKGLVDAVAYSAVKKSIFDDGAVGSLLERGKYNIEGVRAEGTFERTLKPSDEGGAIFKELKKATYELEDGKLMPSQSTVEFEAQASSWIESKFNEALEGSKLSSENAMKFMSNWRTTINQLPELELKLKDKVVSLELQEKAVSAAQDQEKLFRSKSVLSKFMKDEFGGDPNVDVVVSKMFDSPDNNQFNRLLTETSGDSQARDSLKTVVYDLITKRIGIDDNGIPKMSAFNRILSDNKAPLTALYGPEGYKALKEVRDAVDLFYSGKNYKGNRVGSDTAEIGSSTPDYQTVLARIVGAKLGAFIGGSTTGASLQGAAIMSSRAQKFVEKLNKTNIDALLVEAFQNPSLMKKLLSAKLGNAEDVVYKQLMQEPVVRAILSQKAREDEINRKKDLNRMVMDVNKEEPAPEINTREAMKSMMQF